MAHISSCRNFDNVLIKQLTGRQYQLDGGISRGLPASLNIHQRELQSSQSSLTVPYLRMMDRLNLHQWELQSSQSFLTTPYLRMMERLNIHQWELQSSQSFLTPSYLRMTDSLNHTESAWQQFQGAVWSAQQTFDSWTPALQTAVTRQYQAIVPQIETQMLDLIRSSRADLTREAGVSALTSALDAFASVGISDRDLPVSELTEEESAQLASELSEAVEDRQNWQQRLMDIFRDWRERNPVAAFIVQTIAAALISQLFGYLLSWGAAALKDAAIRETPNSKAAVICRIKQGDAITVVGDAPYYYLVEFDDPDSIEPISGYISKKSVKPAQNDD